MFLSFIIKTAFNLYSSSPFSIVLSSAQDQNANTSTFVHAYSIGATALNKLKCVLTKVKCVMPTWDTVWDRGCVYTQTHTYTHGSYIHTCLTYVRCTYIYMYTVIHIMLISKRSAWARLTRTLMASGVHTSLLEMVLLIKTVVHKLSHRWAVAHMLRLSHPSRTASRAPWARVSAAISSLGQRRLLHAQPPPTVGVILWERSRAQRRGKKPMARECHGFLKIVTNPKCKASARVSWPKPSRALALSLSRSLALSLSRSLALSLSLSLSRSLALSLSLALLAHARSLPPLATSSLRRFAQLDAMASMAQLMSIVNHQKQAHILPSTLYIVPSPHFVNAAAVY